MALINCKECGKEVSDTAKACPHCGAKVPKSIALLYAIIGAPIIFVTWVFTREPSPQEIVMRDARRNIEQCWADQGAKSNSASQAQGIAMLCENMEREFRDKYHRAP